MLEARPLVSVIVPCRNEEATIAQCLDSVVASDYPNDRLEILVVDGMSEDSTRKIIGQYSQRFPFIKILDNLGKTQQIALNIGIKHAQGNVIIRMDAHCCFARDYISQCVRYLLETGADNVGGRLITLARKKTVFGQAITYAMSHPFGVGNSYFRVAPVTGDSQPRWVNTVPYSCYRREVFTRVGLFNENLARSEDAEFHQRMKKMGCKTLFVPTIASYYYARSDLKSFFLHSLDNGLWGILPTRYTGKLVIPLKYFIPLGFVSYLIIFGFLSLINRIFLWPFSLGLGLYLFVNFYISLKIAFQKRDPRLFLAMPVVFSALHFGYGWGSLTGCLIVLWNKLFDLRQGGGQWQGEEASTAGSVVAKKSNAHPPVSIVIPCRNEELFISRCLDSIIANDYPKDKLEILVVDGISEDATRRILDAYVKEYRFIRVLDNFKQEQQLALNIGIKNASGEIIFRMDAHSRYNHDYISICVRTLEEYNADNVGGRWLTVPRNDNLVGRAICLATSTVFGVGNAYYRLTSLNSKKPVIDGPRWDISVPYFCCRREVFDKVGLFNDKLDYSEDIDFARRLKKAGLRTLFIPTVECYYFMRTQLREFLRHAFRNGIWVVFPLNFTPHLSFSLRHIIPFIFVLSLLVSGLLLFYPPVGWTALAIILGPYALGSIYYSWRIAWREKDVRYFFILPFIFASLHLTYGLGSVFGVVRICCSKIGLLEFRPEAPSVD